MQQNEVGLALAVLRVLSRHTIDDPITGEALGMMFGITKRKVADIIREARLQGHKIGSSKVKPYGYFLAREPSELAEVVGHMRNEALNILVAVNRLTDWDSTQPTVWEQQEEG